MAGAVTGFLRVYSDDTCEVMPNTCPVYDLHREHTPACFRTYPDGETRACPYWLACTSPMNTADRQHPSSLRVRAKSLGARTVNVQVLCQRQKSNRPPGC
jgi:hypothetical protein